MDLQLTLTRASLDSRVAGITRESPERSLNRRKALRFSALRTEPQISLMCGSTVLPNSATESISASRSPEPGLVSDKSSTPAPTT